jgi:DNA-binding GntR family transcriptional regulator
MHYAGAVDDDLLLPWRRDLSRATAADRVAASVAERIATGALAGGELLTELELAAEHEVSRTPAREALLRLEALGLVRLLPKKGALVSVPTAAERHDLLAVRSMLEREAVATASAGSEAERTSLVAGLDEWIDIQTAVLAEPLRYAEADYGFHLHLMRHGGNAVVEQLAATLAPRLVRLTHLSVATRPDGLEGLRDEHRALRAAIADADPVRFAALIEAHLASGHDYAVAP